MQAFKIFFKYMKYNKIAIISYLAIYIVLSLVLSKNGGEGDVSNFSEKAVRVSIVDNDQTKTSELLENYLATKHTIVELKDGEKETLQDSLYTRYTEYILIIPEGFENALNQGEEVTFENIKVPNSYYGTLVDMDVNNYLDKLQKYIGTGLELNQANLFAQEDLQQVAEVEMTSEGTPAEKVKAIFYYLRYIPYILVTILINMISPMMMRLNEKDLRRRITCSSVNFRVYNQGLVGASIISGIGCLIVFFIMAIMLYGKDVFRAGMSVAYINAFVQMLVGLSIAYILGSVAKSAQALSGMTTVLTLGLNFMGGAFVPLSLMGGVATKISKFVPSSWYVKVNDIVASHSSFNAQQIGEIAKCLGIQLLFAVAIFALGLIINKSKRTQTA